MKRLAVCLLPVLQLLLLATLALPVTVLAKDGAPDFVVLAKKLKPAVVNISTAKTIKPRQQFQRPFGGQFKNDPFHDFFERFFDDVQPQTFKQRSLGSGFIIEGGYILTNNHVIAGADEIKVKLADNREFKAEIKGADERLDLALLKIDAKETLPTAHLGDSDAIQVGEWVMAIGNPFGLSETVTAGIVSAKGRVIGSGPYDDYIQTDASINPGNSGGPLFNSQGEVIGINTAIISGGQGIGFAIPVNLAKSIIPQLRENGKVTRGWLGVVIQPVTADLAMSFGLESEKGALLSEILPGSPAEKSGMKPGDIILVFDGKKINEANDLPRQVAATAIGKKVAMTIMRNGKELKILAVIENLKENAADEVGAATQDKLGLTVRELTKDLAERLQLKDTTGVVVTALKPNGLAQDAGIAAGDIIKEINGTPIASLEDYDKAVAAHKKGQVIRFLLKRGERSLYVAATLD
ncbi:MAG: DegQ family serine endoprotease [Desulfuromonadaceae bacterium]|nr:DegQ family serine endoprotease [Desulfuromonadaceae bacterium]MDD2849912.1 DegQ family serine endoprotease [Desulfuromonadaceae bacterium]MDD4131729.1 DegQ family serine endoprotease [Desulfuromonadaceae bacterium]